MNVLGFFAVLAVCATALGITVIIFSKTFTITHLHKDITEKVEDKIDNQIGFYDKEISQKPQNENQEIPQNISKASMDAVIKAANELMGITIEEDSKDAK